MSKVFKHDPLWAAAKKACRLNQRDIEMAKALGLKPKTLIKNKSSSHQQWKLPVKQWIHELYEKRFGHGKFSKERADPSLLPTANPSGEARSEPSLRSKPRFRRPAARYEPEEWDDEDDFYALVDGLLPSLEFEIALNYRPEDADWRNLRLARRQKNLCWVAASLTVRWREIEAVEQISLFGSVARALRDPFGQPWEGPDTQTACHTLNLALWVTRWNESILCSINLVLQQTLASLADLERIAVEDKRFELLLLDAATDRLLGRLQQPAAADILPSLGMPPDFVFKLEPLVEPQAIILFRRTPPPCDNGEDIDIPF